jgi:nucleoside phosphorylase
MGPENAEVAARQLFEEASVNAAFAVGLAAGLDPRLQTGDLIVGSKVILHQRDARTTQSFTCDSGLQESALAVIRHTGYRYHVGPIASVEQLVPATDEKRRLAAGSGAMAADMESAAIASVASNRAIPFLAIRVILDPVDENLEVAFEQFLDERGEPRPLPLIRYVITHPLVVPRLVGLGLRTRAACTHLGELLRNFSILPI